MTHRAEEHGSAKSLLGLIESAVKSSHLYGPDHPRAQEAVERAWYGAFAHLNDYGRVVYDFEDGQIFHGGTLMVDESVACAEVMSALERGKGNRLAFEPGLTQERLAALILLFAEEPAQEPASPGDSTALGARIKDLGLVNIEVKRMSRRQMKKKTVKKSAGGREALYLRYERAIADLSTLFDDLRSGRSLNPAKTKTVAAWVAAATDTDCENALALTAVRNHDEYLCHHSLNVAIFSTALGRAAGVEEANIEGLAFAALLHDVGKVTLPPEILRKPGALSSDEWALMSDHPANGVRIINERLEEEATAMVVAFEHHLGHDLSGYPKVADGWRPHLYSRLVQVADVYDGMTADRSYRRPKLRSEAVTLITGDLAHLFEPVLARLFIKMIGIFPIGSVLRLDNGETALVRGVDPGNLKRPIVKALAGSPGRLIRLADEPSIGIVEVVHAASAGVNLSHALSSD